MATYFSQAADDAFAVLAIHGRHVDALAVHEVHVVQLGGGLAQFLLVRVVAQLVGPAGYIRQGIGAIGLQQALHFGPGRWIQLAPGQLGDDAVTDVAPGLHGGREGGDGEDGGRRLARAYESFSWSCKRFRTGGTAKCATAGLRPG